MKNLTENCFYYLSITFSFLLVSCDKSEKPENIEADNVVFNGNQNWKRRTEFEIMNHIHLKRDVYTKGWVYVTDGATLSIEPGQLSREIRRQSCSYCGERRKDYS